MCKYLDSLSVAATANTERMQEMMNANSPKDNQLREMMAILDA